MNECIQKYRRGFFFADTGKAFSRAACFQRQCDPQLCNGGHEQITVLVCVLRQIVCTNGLTCPSKIHSAEKPVPDPSYEEYPGQGTRRTNVITSIRKQTPQ